MDETELRRIVRSSINRIMRDSRGDVSRGPMDGAAGCDLPHATRLKRMLLRGERAYGLWITLESPTLTEIAARLGFDWVVIDAEHGHLDLRNIMEHARIANLAGIACLVRVSDVHAGLIKRVLDIGADGILVPQIRSAEEVEKAVRYAKYPPEGIRGIGAERSTRWARGIPKCVPRANAGTLVIPLIETEEAVQDIDEIASVPGVDAFYFGPHDFSANAGRPGVWNDRSIMTRLLSAKDRLRERRLPCGIMAFEQDEVETRQNEGFTMIGFGMDTGLFIQAAAQLLQRVGRSIPGDAWD